MKILFAIGLILQLIAQISFSIHSKEINLLKPIDFIHWMLLVGVVLIIPHALNFSKGVFQKFGVVCTLIGIISHIGMCAIDFVLWSFEDNLEGRNALIEQLRAEPSIWLVFFSIGPVFLGTGLTIQALGHWKDHFTGTMSTLLGTLLMGVYIFLVPEQRLILIVGYLVFAIGLLIITFGKKE